MRTIKEIDMEIEKLKQERAEVERCSLREYDLQYQWELPRQLQHIALNYPTVSWIQTINLYTMAVDQVLLENKIEVLSELRFGKGRALAKAKFMELLKAEEEAYYS